MASRLPVSLAALWAALFGLQAALCTVACLAAPAADAMSMAQHAPAEPMPCHGAPADPSPSQQPAPAHPDSERACGCDVTGFALVEVAEAPVPAPGLAAPVAPLARRDRAAPAAARIGAWERLPPPDLLLWNSTLLI